MADFTGDGKADVARIYKKTGAVDYYINHGSADTSVAGDGIRFGDLDGDGLDDYLFIDLHGKTTLYLNGGPLSPKRSMAGSGRLRPRESLLLQGRAQVDRKSI